MILKSLKLENIRSYKDHKIDFLSGTTLFEGDIGSGKSTLLMAIEFSLFGLGSEKAGALLRTGESKGTVGLCFEVDDQEYEVQRTLVKKGKSIQQAEGYIRTKSGILHLSPSELKEKVLEILSFNEPADPKAQSSIYRYAVFTPQEEMKAILVMNPDARLQTLRKVFRIEDYKTACNNAQTTSKAIQKHSDILQATASDLDIRRKELGTKTQELSIYKEELKTLLAREKACENALGDLRKRQEDLKGERDKLSRVEGEIPEIEKQLKDKSKSKTDSEKSAEKALRKINELRPKLEEMQKIEKPTDKSIEQLSRELADLQKQQRELVKNQSALDTKIKDYLHIEEKGICPTCDRPIDSAEFKTRVEAKRKEEETIAGCLVQCDKELEHVQKMTDGLKKYNDSQQKIEELEDQVKEQQQILTENTNIARTIAEEIVQLQERLSKAKGELAKFKELSERLVKLDEEVSKADKASREVGRQVEGMNTKIKEVGKRVAELESEVKIKEETVKKADFLAEYTIWLDDYFIPTVENIEKHVLITVQQEFDELFQHWFSLLVEDPTKDARIDEDFTPIIEQDGYEQEVLYLSGGERTSVALAYRLALNMLVRRVSASMKSGLLILDEPTDGFSKEQLFKIRDILKELECPQIVIVSHEKELESFADQVYKVTKVNGASCVGA
jgi:exonuclease SbcC